jgi:ribose 1,5-bisphosphokinase PhnN
MRKREREENKQRRRYIERTTEEVKEKEKAFSEHTQKAFSALGDARGVGVAGVGVACRAWLRVGLVVVVAMSLSLFTARAG